MAPANPLKLGAQLEALVSSLAVLPAVGRNLALLRRDIKGLRQDIATLPDLIRDLTSVVERMTEEVEGMHRDVVVIGDRVEPLASQLEPLAPTLGGLDPRLADLLDEIQGMRRDLGRLPFMGGRRTGRAGREGIAPATALPPVRAVEPPDPADVANDAT